VSKPEPEHTHFWFMSVMATNPRGLWVNDYQGTLTPAPGATRLETFNQIREEVATKDPRSRHAIVLAFDIQPNRIDGGTR
jgi:hypothetical protein